MSDNDGKKELNINNMPRKDFEALPHRGWSEDIGPFDSLIILPQRRLHDSGYRCMDFVACRGNTPICRLSGCSDVVHIDGIGGYGKNWLKTFGQVSLPPKGWSIDCLKKSGLLRLFCLTESFQLEAGSALSSFEIHAVERKGGGKKR